MKTNLPALLVLCGEVQSTQRDQEKVWDAEAGGEAVGLARQYAEIRFGAQAAEAFGEWLPLEIMADDCLQAAVQITPFAVLRFTSHCDEGNPRFELFGHCPTCANDETVTVTNLLTLAAALQSVGVR